MFARERIEDSRLFHPEPPKPDIFTSQVLGMVFHEAGVWWVGQAPEVDQVPSL